MLKKLILLILALLTLNSVASAQTPEKYTAKVYSVGISNPAKIFELLPTVNYTCGQFGSTAPATNVDPNFLQWSDPNTVVVNRVCHYSDPGNGPLKSVGGGNWELTITPIFGTVTGPESDRTPFSVSVVLVKPVGLRFFKQ